MSIDRREFLKLAGISTVLGFGGVSAVTGLRRTLEASEVMPNPEALVAKKWGMVVDMSKFKTEEDYQKCIDACNHVHNVPSIDNPKKEIKWIWEEHYENAFPGMRPHIFQRK